MPRVGVEAAAHLAVAGATGGGLRLPRPPPNEVYAGVLGPSYDMTIASRRV